MDIKKYKWLYLWIAAGGLIVFGFTMLFAKSFGQSVVLYISSILLIIFVIIRFIPLIKTTKNRWAICANSIEMAADLVVGIMILVSAIKGNATKYNNVFPFLLGGVLYARGFVYFIETEFFGTKVEISKFFIHLVILTAGTIIIARYKDFTPEMLRWIFAFAFLITGTICIIDGGNNYSRYRRTSTTKKLNKTKLNTNILDKDIPDANIEDKKDDVTYTA